MIEGHDELLYAIVQPEAAYFIDVRDHDGFDEDQDLFNVACANWPDLFAHAVAQGFVPSDSDLSSETRSQLRKAGFTTFFDGPDGKLYLPPGGGVVKSGLSLDVRRVSDRIMNGIRNVELWCRDNGDDLADRVARVRGYRPTTLTLKLCEVSTRKVVLREAATLFRFHVPLI